MFIVTDKSTRSGIGSKFLVLTDTTSEKELCRILGRVEDKNRVDMIA